MKNTVKVVMLPTEKAKGHTLWTNGNAQLLHTTTSVLGILAAQHLYLVSDEKIKKGDWFIFDNELEEYDGFPSLTPNCKKVLATTDKSLTEEHDDTVPFLKMRPTGIARIPESFVKAYIKAEGKIDDVEVEYDYDPVNTGKNNTILHIPKLNDAGEVIIHMPEIKMYSKIEVANIIERFVDYFNLSAGYPIKGMDEWINNL